MRAACLLLASAALLIAGPAAAQDPPEPWEISTPPAEPPLPPPPAAAPPPAAVPPPAAARPPTFVVTTEPPPADQLKTRMNSPTLFVSGILLSGVGFVGFFTGMGLFYATDPNCEVECRPLTAGESDQRDAGLGLLLGGGALFALGLPMLLIGGKQVPDKPAWAQKAPVLLVGGRSAALRWSF